jgi:hypothetical protein
MMLLTKEIKSKLPKLYTHDGKPANEVPIVIKFFTPDSNYSWFITEGEEQENGDWLFFGMVHGFEKEMGYFTLNELQSVKGTFGLGVERDMYYGNHTLAEVQ